MGVYINMEMPTRCGDCPMGDALCCSLMPGVPALWKEYTLAIRTNRRHEDCPLVPVPPHGRLGDLDALKEIILDYIEEYSWLEEDGLHNLKWCAMKEVEAVIDAAPTIIPASEEGE